MSRLLFKNPFIPYVADLAEKVGLLESLILQLIGYWLYENASKEHNYRDGRYWTYNTMDEWHKEFKCVHINTLKAAFSKLEKEGYLISANYNASKTLRTKWYTIDYKLLEDLQNSIDSEDEVWNRLYKKDIEGVLYNGLYKNCTMGRMGDTEDGYGKSPSEPVSSPLYKNCTMQSTNSVQSYTKKNKTKTKEKKVIIKDDNNLLLLLEEKRAQAASEAQRASFKNKEVAKEDLYIPRDWELNPVQREEVKQEFQGYGVTDEILDKRTKAFIAWHREHKTEDSVWLFKFKGFLENWLKKRAATPKEPKAKKVVDTKQQIGNMSGIDESIIRQAAASRLREQEEAEAKERAEAEKLANRTPFEVLKDEILCYLFAGNEILVAHCGLSNLHIQELDSDCLRFGGYMMTERVGDRITYQRKITEAVKALKPEITKVVFE